MFKTFLTSFIIYNVHKVYFFSYILNIIFKIYTVLSLYLINVNN
jgi:hypothetical protein